jgi:hypothetical protein
MSTNSKSKRFVLGKTYYFAKVTYNRTAVMFMSRFVPWEDTLKEIKVIGLKCTEHHKVPGEWDDKKVHDGFVFKSEDGKEYYNQYPIAVYGQLDDSNNLIVREKVPDDLTDIADIDYFDWQRGWTLATTVINHEVQAVTRPDSITPFSQYMGDEMADGPEGEAVREYLAQLVNTVETATGKKVVSRSIVSNGKVYNVKETILE